MEGIFRTCVTLIILPILEGTPYIVHYHTMSSHLSIFMHIYSYIICMLVQIRLPTRKRVHKYMMRLTTRLFVFIPSVYACYHVAASEFIFFLCISAFSFSRAQMLKEMHDYTYHTYAHGQCSNAHRAHIHLLVTF